MSGLADKKMNGASDTVNLIDDAINALIDFLITGFNILSGVVTFTNHPITPSSAPTTNYQVANKKYVDDEIDAIPSFATSLATKVYGSDWFAVSSSGSYTLTHGLGTTALLLQVFYSASSDGSSPMLVRNWDAENAYSAGFRVDTITTTQLTVKTGGNGVNMTAFPNTLAGSGYYKVVALALA